ncbi:hypothetical protein EIKCOROL_01801 [Eikenella corrodens ATCC 23834]|uniref:Uncharacterized protein n=1 Tax=Eikenella corrodens ATCC 23834 TaxID=546274 RepID=C0DWP8_EIKCO|nr:hypothetical protein EIKCOROL_01801 [Eikenella corrodens ATCC 23834]
MRQKFSGSLILRWYNTPSLLPALSKGYLKPCCRFHCTNALAP